MSTIAVALILTFLIGLLIAGYSLFREQEDKVNCLEGRLKPRLHICSGTYRVGDRWRIRVHNLSGGTVQFGARLEHADPPLTDYQMPLHLQITGTPPPHRNSVIPGSTEFRETVASVDIVLDSDDRAFGILSAEHPPGAIPIAKVRYVLTICAFPISPDGGQPAFRRFHVVPQPDGSLILSDAGVPSDML